MKKVKNNLFLLNLDLQLEPNGDGTFSVIPYEQSQDKQNDEEEY